MRIDPTIYFAHAGFWGTVGGTRLILRSSARKSGRKPEAPTVSSETTTAPFSRALVALHMVAFGVMYWGIGQAVFSSGIPERFGGQRIVGFLIMALGALIMAWALVYFRSWRFRAKLEEGHQLATGGPFRILRHPIYMGLNLLALGSAVWIPTAPLWIGFLLMVIGSDLRARAEEKILGQAFGQEYRDYCERTRRFLPGLY